MTPKRYGRLTAVTVFGAASISAASAKEMITTASLHSHNGTYAVDITTRHGDCEKHHRWTILVSGGRVSSGGSAPMSVSGQITPHGDVHLTFKRFHHVATVTGRLTTEAGSGSWHSPTMECTGSWHAHRRS